MNQLEIKKATQEFLEENQVTLKECVEALLVTADKVNDLTRDSDFIYEDKQKIYASLNYLRGYIEGLTKKLNL